MGNKKIKKYLYSPPPLQFARKLSYPGVFPGQISHSPHFPE